MASADHHRACGQETEQRPRHPGSSASVLYGVPCITTLPAAEACVLAMEALRTAQLGVQAIQDRFPESVAAW